MAVVENQPLAIFHTLIQHEEDGVCVTESLKRDDFYLNQKLSCQHVIKPCTDVRWLQLLT